MNYQEQKNTTRLVVVSGDFNPPCNHHQMLVQGGKKVAESIGAPFMVYLRSGGLLSEDKQEAYFRAAFPNIQYKRVATNDFRDDSEIYVVGETLQCYQLAESVEIPRVLNAMNVEAASGNYYSFKSHLPIGMPDVSARRLMNDIREALGYDAVDYAPPANPLRESYLRENKYTVGSLVESDGEVLTVTKRGTNYLVCTTSEGTVVQRWLHQVTPHD